MNIQNLSRAFTLTSLVLVLAVAAPGEAQFMNYPFYGTPTLNSYFDHEYPDYSTNGDLMRYDGQTGSWSYDGHSGVDYGEVYTPILSAAGGTFNYVGWWSTNHESSYGLAMKIDHDNGYQTLYGHLSSVLYGSGDWVQQARHIGTGGTTGNSTGPHLHFEPRRKVGSSWRVVDPLGWSAGFTDPWQASSGAVSTYLYLADPLTSWPSNLGTTTIDNTSSRFSKGCDAGSNCPFWYSSSAGYGGGMYFTYSNGTVEDYWARWRPNLTAADNYEVQVHIPNSHATTHAARYTITHAFGSRTVNLDQHDTYGTGTGRWVSLGTYYFNSGTGGSLKITDATYIPGNYTEPASTNRKVGVDAARFIRRGTQRFLRQFVWDNDACTEYKSAVAETGEILWGSTTTGSCPTSAPGSGAVQTYFSFVTGGKLHEAMWRGGNGYSRSIAISGGQVQWGQAPGWSSAGSGGTYQGQGGYVLGDYLHQMVWDNNSCTEYKTELDASANPDWGTTTTSSCPTSAPGSGPVQTYFAFISGSNLNEALWRGGSGYSRSVPIDGGVVKWNQAPAWSFVGSGGTYQAQDGFILP